MRKITQTQYDRQMPPRGQCGFTVMEALVATTIVGLIMSMVVGSSLSLHRNFFTDVVRTRINGNLRSALDIVSMNIRQAGENLRSSFPAVVVNNGAGAGPDILTLRRSLIPEVLTLCENANAGTAQLFVSSSGFGNAGCVSGNVQPIYDVFNELRIANGGSMDIYIYDRSTRTGEFFTYSSGGISSGRYFLSSSSLGNNYTAINSGIYILEEFRFSLNTVDSTLELFIDGDLDTPNPVAFDITEFSIELIMDDDSAIQSLLPTDVGFDWKDIRLVQVLLGGEEEYRTRTLNSEILGEFFPRNVLSLD